MRNQGRARYHLQKIQNRPRPVRYGPVPRIFLAPALIVPARPCSRAVCPLAPGPTHRYRCRVPCHRAQIVQEWPLCDRLRLMFHLYSAPQISAEGTSAPLLAVQVYDSVGLIAYLFHNDANCDNGLPPLKGDTVAFSIKSVLVFLPGGAIPDFKVIPHTRYC